MKIKLRELKRLIRHTLNETSDSKQDDEESAKVHDEYVALGEKMNNGTITPDEMRRLEIVKREWEQKWMPKMRADLNRKTIEHIRSRMANKPQFKPSDPETISRYGYDPNDPRNRGRRGLGS